MVSLKPGDTVFDVGVAWGVMTSMFASIVSRTGAKGQVHSFEANPKMLPVIDTLVNANGLQGVVTVNNNLICDQSGKQSVFYVVDGYQAVASSANSCVRDKGGKEVYVETLALDDYCKEKNLYPDYVKIDIEGAEYVAVMGMKQLIQNRHPIFQIETHGTEIDAIGGSLFKLLRFLEQSGYRLFNLEKGVMTTAEEHAEAYAKRTGQLLATTDFREEILSAIDREYHTLCRELEWEKEHRELADTVRKMIDQGAMEEAEKALHDNVTKDCCLAEENYLYAFAIQKKNVEEAVKHYDIALQKGFSEFWVRYNKAATLISAGHRDEARDDLLAAYRLDQNHEGVLFYMHELGMK